MESRNAKQADLVPILGGRGRVSELVNGKRAISKAQAKSSGRLLSRLSGVVPVIAAIEVIKIISSFLIIASGVARIIAPFFRLGV